jgi:hypothetical protein
MAAVETAACYYAAGARNWRGLPTLARAPAPAAPAVGDAVVLRGLKARPELVGQVAEVVTAAGEEGDRVGVRVTQY